MAVITADEGQKRPQPKAGIHNVALVQVIDLGTQPGSKAYPDPKRKIELMFEVLDEKGDFGGEMKPFAVWQYANPYISKDRSKITNYHKLVNQLFGPLSHEEAKAVDFETILGTVYIAQLVNNGDFTNIDNLIKGTTKQQEEYADYEFFNDKLFFSLEDFNQRAFDSLRDKKQEKIKNSPEYQKLFISSVESSDDDLPL